MRLLVATRTGIAAVGWIDERGWRGQVSCLARAAARIYAGTDGADVLRSDDDGATWRATGLDGVRVRSLAVSGDRVVAGAQPAAVHLSDDGGASWRTLESFPSRVLRWSGRSWTPLTEELRELPHALVCPQPDGLVAGLRDGTLLSSSGHGEAWRSLATVDGVRAIV